MTAFPGVADQVRADMHLHKHFRYFLREARVVAYAQVCVPPRWSSPPQADTGRHVRRLSRAVLTAPAALGRASSSSRTRA